MRSKEQKEEKQILQPEAQGDDALFDALNRSKKKKKRKLIITICSVVLAAAIAAVITVVVLRKSVREKFASSSGEVLSYEVTSGTISTVVSGSGTLTDKDLTSVTVPAGVEITEVVIKTNDKIAEGDLIAKVNTASVMSAMADLQAEIEALDKKISGAEDDAASDTITAGVSGRVKAVYITKGADVADVMYQHGALALISLDGYMAVDVETDALSAGDSVRCKLSGGKEVTGSVESVSGGKATVLITDDGPSYGEEVAVLDKDGREVGKGKLYIHSALRVTGYAGTAESVNVTVNDKVSESTKICTLKDTGYSANYNTLLRSRNEKEETLLALLKIKQNGAVLSPVTGSVYSVDYSEASSGAEMSEETIAVATLSNDEKMYVTVSVDESDILSLEQGQEVEVSVSSVSEDSFPGTLTQIDKTSSSSGTYSATVELDKSEGMLSGMTASVSVKIEGVENALLIPIEALHQTADGAYVYTSYDEDLQEYGGKVDVVTGLENSTYVEIKSGLSAGDTVYYTEKRSGFSGFGGNFPSFGGGSGSGMPSFNGGEMPDFGGNMPSFGGGSGRSSGSGSGRPSGGFPGGN